MSGYSTRAFDLDRLLHYSFFTPQGLTVHERGLSALVRFIGVRAELFRTIYSIAPCGRSTWAFRNCSSIAAAPLPGNPLEHLDDYQRLTNGRC